MTNQELAIAFFLQLACILAAVRIVGWCARCLGQPQVVGEMIAGILLGPSLFGALAPEVQASLFPPESIPLIYVVSQVGLTLYMFLIGTEFNLDLVRRQGRSAAAVSLAGIIVPFGLGGALALVMLADGRYFTPAVTEWEAMLFVGAAMSITAFPMLARIIRERGLAGTMLGTLALAAGSIDDAAAWCILAVVLASFGGDVAIAVWAVGGGLLYALVVLWLGRPLFRWFEQSAQRSGGVTPGLLGSILALLMVCGWYTDYVGIYSVFGAFLLGVAMPRGVVTRDLNRQLEPVVTNFLLPLFFVYSGLNTRLDLISDPQLFGMLALVLLAACAGKFAACGGAALFAGSGWRTAGAVGALMNARGLMELILLNIGLQQGIITPTLFAMMVTMAVVTTLMAVPLFELAWRDPERIPDPLPAA